MSNQDPQVNTSEDFIAEFETMDLSELKDKSFCVAVSTGDRNKPKFLSTTLHGPYNFTEMVEEVGLMWAEHQHHAKVIIMEKNRDKRLKTLDENTVDFIEAHYVDIATESMLEGLFDEEKVFTCKAGFAEAEADANPTHKVKEVAPASTDDEDL